MKLLNSYHIIKTDHDDFVKTGNIRLNCSSNKSCIFLESRHGNLANNPINEVSQILCEYSILL